jgi:hypothetical protein
VSRLSPSRPWPAAAPLGASLVAAGAAVFLGAFTNVPWEPLLRPWVGTTFALAAIGVEVLVVTAGPYPVAWAALLTGSICWLPAFVIAFHVWLPWRPISFSLFYGYPRSLSPLETFLVGAACTGALFLGAYLVSGRTYRATTLRAEATGWLALVMVAVAVCVLWRVRLSYLLLRPLGTSGTAFGALFLLGQAVYCWVFDVRAGWRWLRDVWLLWIPVFTFFLIADTWGHLLGRPAGLGELAAGGAGLSGLAAGGHVLREAALAR